MAEEYTVTVEKKLPTHIWYNKGSSLCYAINGKQGTTLTLTRGFRYTFHINTPGHPFYFSTSETGAGDGDLISNRGVDSGVLSVLITKEMPSNIYYQCMLHEKMGGIIHIVDHHSIHLLPIATNLTSPLCLFQLPGSEDMYIADQTGLITRMSDGYVLLDLRSRMVPLNTSYDERGLLDVVVSPNYNTNKQLFVVYSATIPESDKKSGLPYETRLSKFVVRDNTVIIDSEEILVRIHKTLPIHNGGRLAFDNSGWLYMTTGDGGPQKDPTNRSQDKHSLLGKVLRLDATSEMPKIEMYALGLRNPWSISFDTNNRCFVADVGYNDREEVNLVTRGSNYGWNIFQGTMKTGFNTPKSGEKYIDPIWEYTHEWMNTTNRGRGVVAVIGGYYINGVGYVFGDYSGVIMRIDLDENTNKWRLLENVTTEHYIRAFSRINNRVFVLTTSGTGLKHGEGRVFEVLF